MPDPNGDITSGEDSVIGSASPVLAGVNNGPNAKPGFSVSPDEPDIGVPIAPGPALGSPDSMGQNQQPPAPPTQQPTFFRKLLFSLGQGLIEGTKAGLEAPRNAQGPAVAAQTAINAPQQKREQLTTNQMNDMNVAMTQLKLHQIQMVTHQMDEDAQNAVYNSGRDVTTALMEKGKVNVLATGDQKSVQDEFTRRQADAKAGGQGLLPLQILPAAGSSAKDPKYALIDVGKDRLTDDIEDTWGAKDLGVSEEDFKAAGLTPFNFKAPAGMDQQKALQLMTTQHLNWLTKSQNQLGQMKRQQASLDSRESEGAANRASRLQITDMKLKASLQKERQTIKNAPPFVTKVFSDYEDSVSRLDSMNRDMAELAKKPKNEGSFDMDLLANHIAITMGGVKGMRVGKDIIEQHMRARDLPADVEVAANKVLNGRLLDPKQRKNFIELAKGRVDEAKRKYDDTKDEFGITTAGDAKRAAGGNTTPAAKKSVDPLGIL